jgi:hypothetical protein
MPAFTCRSNITGERAILPTSRTFRCADETCSGEFAELARERGDFDWHVAYHPYPENLGDPRFWLDKSATPDDASPRITFKNLQVLTTHLARPELLWKGQTRRIILSEQGFHCREELPDGEAVQAAAFCYAWRKVAALPAIDAFILHRHVDHAYEGPQSRPLDARAGHRLNTRQETAAL